MRRNLTAAAAIAVLLILVGSVYLAGLPPFNSPPSSSGSTALTSVSSSLSTSTQGGVAVSTIAVGQDWTTYHRDNARTGYQKVANFTSVTRSWNSTTLDGIVFAQPLVYAGDVFVATENNSVYALNAQNGKVVWRTNLGPPVVAKQLPCGDIFPVTGITGTPVIDPTTGILYVVSFSEMHHTLSALKASTGAVVFHESATPPGFNDTTQQERTALTLSHGMVYIGYGGLAGDCGQYYGWEVGLPANAPGTMVYYQVPVTREGAIWAPSGASADPSGNIYVATGNGASTTTFDHSNSVIKLSPALTEEGYFAPADWLQLNQNDADLGSLAPAIVGPDLLFQIGKEGVGYLLNASQLGGIGGQISSAPVCSESFGATAFSSPIIFVPCINGLIELQVGNGTFSTKLQIAGLNAGPPTVTDGVVWTVDSNSGTLFGLSVSDGHQDYTFSLGSVEHFTSLAAGEGRLFVAATNVVESFVLG